MSPRRGSQSPDLDDLKRVVTVGIVIFSRHYRRATLEVLKRSPGLNPVDLGAGGEESERELVHHEPEVLLVDLPRKRLLPFILSARRSQPSLTIIVANCDETEEDLLPLFEAGISGFVPSEAEEEELLRTIRLTLGGEVHCPPRIVSALVRRLQKSGGRRNAAGLEKRLTPREMQVATYLEQGLSNKEIAARLQIEVSTAKNHVHSILAKLSIHRRGEAASMVRGDTGPALRVVGGRRRSRNVPEGRSN